MKVERWIRGALGAVVAVSALAGPGSGQRAMAAVALAPIRWVERAPLPAARSDMAVVAGKDGNIYAFGGTDGIHYDSNQTLIYHPTSDRWSAGATMPIPTSGAAAVLLRDGRIAVLGGGVGCQYTMTCTIYHTAQVYNPKTHAWCLLAPMLAARYRFGAALGPDGRLYAIGGWNGASALASVEAYNFRSNTWAYVAALPQAELGDPAVVTHGRIAVVGGYDGTGAYYNNLFVFNGHRWESGSPMPTDRGSPAVTLDARGHIVAVGGYNETGYVATVERYDPGSDSWTSATPLPAALTLAGAATGPGGDVFVLGGYDGHVSDHVYAFGPHLKRHNPFSS